MSMNCHPSLDPTANCCFSVLAANSLDADLRETKKAQKSSRIQRKSFIRPSIEENLRKAKDLAKSRGPKPDLA
jgi:hypothetical protein